MQESQRTSVQADAPAKRANGPILGIAINWMAMMRKLHAQLMRAAGLRADLQPSQSAMHATAMIVQERLPSAFIALLHNLDAAAVFVLAQPIFEGAGSLADLALNDGPINLLDRAFTELLAKTGRCLAGPREQHHSRHRTVETMDNAHEHIAGLVILLFEIRLHGAIERFFAAFVMGAQNAARLDDGGAV